MKKKLVEYLLYIFMYRNCYIGKVFIYMIFRINDFINYKYFIFYVKILMFIIKILLIYL